MTTFADHLWSDLVREHGPALASAERPEPRRAHRLVRPRVLALGLAGAGTAVALALGAVGTTPAYAVTTNADGSVTLQLNETSALPQANAKLEAMGIGERVAIVMAAGPAAVSGPVSCTPAPGAQRSGPQLKVLVGSDGTEAIAPGETGGNSGVGTWHLDRCLVTGVSGPGTSGTSGGAG